MEQEISLREIIEVILKGKWIILIVTILAIVFSGINSFFIASPVYETNSIVSVQQNSSEEAKIKVDLNALSETLRSDSAMHRIAEMLDIDPNKYTMNQIRNFINLEASNDAGIMKIKVKSDNPLLITNIANILAFELGNRIEISEQSQTIVELQDQLKNITDKIIVSKSELGEAQKQMVNTPEIQTVKQRFAEDDILKELIRDSGSTDVLDVVELQLENESINPLYTLLQTRIAEVKIGLTSLQTEEQNLNSRIKKSTDRIKQLDSNVSQEKLSSKTAERLLNGYQAVFISPAIQPTEPVGPNKLLNIIIAGFLGCILSMLIVFLRHYLRNTSTPVTRTTE